MKANLVVHFDELINPGDFMPAQNNQGIIMVCPGCGKISAPRDNTDHIYDPNTFSVNPSIVHNIELGGCGWHGWLKNNEFIL